MKTQRKVVISKKLTSLPSSFMQPTMSSMMRVANIPPESYKEKFFS